MAVMAPISWGELIDKFTILEIKSDKILDPEKLSHVRHELEALRPLRDRGHQTMPGLVDCERELKAVNEALWEIEDAIRDCDRRKEFGAEFIRLAKSVYRENDRRAALKWRINHLLGSELVEEKSYRSY